MEKEREAHQHTEPASQQGGQPASSLRSYYALAILTLVIACSALDRTIITVVLEPIKKEFMLSDTMLGLMVGFGFALLYSLCALPIARLADRKSRVAIMTIGLVFWSAMTAVHAFAQSAIQVLLARIGVGVGESCAAPLTGSVLADYFPKNKRPMANSILSSAQYLGTYAAFLIGGFATTYWGWRSVFIVAGIPGFVVAALLIFTVKEPRRGAVDGHKADTKLYSIGQTITILAKNRTYFFLLCGFCLTSITDLAVASWFASFLIRVHHLTMIQVGAVGGGIKSIAGVAGVLLGGIIVGWISKKNDKWKLRAPGITSMLAGPCLAGFLLMPMPMAWVLLALGVFLAGVRMGPIMGVVQTVVKVRMRAFAAATFFLTGMIFGMGLGPIIIGGLNDLLKPALGPLAIRYSLLAAAATSMIGAAFFLAAVRHLQADMAKNVVE
jgi:MFS family permease